MSTVTCQIWVDPPTLEAGLERPHAHPTPAEALAVFLETAPPELSPAPVSLYVDRTNVGPFEPLAAAAWLRREAPTSDGFVVSLLTSPPVELPADTESLELLEFPDDEPRDAATLVPLGEASGGWRRFTLTGVPPVEVTVEVDAHALYVSSQSRLELWHPTRFDGQPSELCARNNTRLQEMLEAWVAAAQAR